ncbi:YcxB family protein [Maribacter sp. MAR_2009_72]|uniref:YcxB family protein n=1 Tax=Maribacter sp. MAR_2009_72 TaxID=1250050 RepID=UPI00119A14BC|nr:hypothetical protein [Maribacter sp. MAR_2009_72]TVZ15979.1 hypothetical protein JM81_2231 [Maribacter sp. MAR_2009_72]
MVTKSVVSNFKHIMSGKMYFFFKKSVWSYLLATLMIAVVVPIKQYNFITSFLIYFFGLMLIVFPIMIMAAKVQGEKMEFDAEVTFSEEKIAIRHRNKDLVETKDWNWIKKISATKDRFVLVVNQRQQFVIALAKDELTQEEIAFFETKI